jgi:sugar lactone lactonase YvrE
MTAELVADTKCTVGEGPVWDTATRQMLWVDIPHGRVYRLDASTGSVVQVEVGQPVGAIVPRASGGFIVATPEGIAHLRTLDGVRPELIAEIERDRPANRSNDGKCDPAGRFWFGTMSTTSEDAAGSLYRLDRDLSLHRMVKGTTISNGLGWSPDGSRMYFIDTPTGAVDAFDYKASSGAITRRHQLVNITPDHGLPDGMAVDAEGGLWVAFWGGGAVRRYTAEGELDCEVALPVSQVSSCCFGGVNLDELYVTTAAMGLTDDEVAAQPGAGGLFRCEPGVRGLATTPFAG